MRTSLETDEREATLMNEVQTDAPPLLAATMDDDSWGTRLAALHRQLFASDAPEFNDVMTHVYQPPEGYILHDHCAANDGKNWHLYYITGPIKYAEAWIAHMRAGRYAEARKIPYEMSDGHAMGPWLNQLRYVGDILSEPQGEFGLLLQGTSNIIRFEDHWVNVYTGRGPHGQCLCLARSRDLMTWDLEPSNPFWKPHGYARERGACKNASLIRHPTDGRYLVYYCVSLRDGNSAVALLSTTDFKHYADHGPVFTLPHQLRGTGGIEAPCVILRNGMWHLFAGAGEGVWHTISPSPDDFMGMDGRGASLAGAKFGAQRGCYLFGRFHCVEVFEHAGKWWMSSTRKEYERYLNRKAGILKFRGSAADEESVLHGLFMCELKWDGDQPIPTRDPSLARKPNRS